MKINEEVRIGDSFFTDDGEEIEILDEHDENSWLVWEKRDIWPSGKKRVKPKSIVTMGIRQGFYHRG